MGTPWQSGEATRETHHQPRPACDSHCECESHYKWKETSFILSQARSVLTVTCQTGVEPLLWFLVDSTTVFFFFLIEVQLIYNVSRVHQSDSDFPGGLACEESISSVGDLGLIPGLGRSPGEGKGYPLQYSDLENSEDWIVHGITKSQTQPSDFRFTFKVIQLHLSSYRCTSSFLDSFPL